MKNWIRTGGNLDLQPVPEAGTDVAYLAVVSVGRWRHRGGTVGTAGVFGGRRPADGGAADAPDSGTAAARG